MPVRVAIRSEASESDNQCVGYTRSTAYDQVNDLFSNMGIGASVEGAWIVVRLAAGSPTYWTCYASIVDDLTGDPAFIPPVGP